MLTPSIQIVKGFCFVASSPVPLALLIGYRHTLPLSRAVALAQVL